MSVYVGIDPGRLGAIAAYDPASGALSVHDLPSHKVKVNGTLRTRIDAHGLRDLLRAIAYLDCKAVMLEQTWAHGPKAGAAMHTLGHSAGMIEQGCAWADLPLHLTPSATWKKAMCVTNDKDEARLIASRLLPAHAGCWPLVKHDGRAEAALLALYAVRKLTS